MNVCDVQGNEIINYLICLRMIEMDIITYLFSSIPTKDGCLLK